MWCRVGFPSRGDRCCSVGWWGAGFLPWLLALQALPSGGYLGKWLMLESTGICVCGWGEAPCFLLPPCLGNPPSLVSLPQGIEVLLIWGQ